MKTARRSTHHTVDIIRLALPIWIGQLAAIANPVLDTAMVSRYSVTDLGALAVGASVYISVYVALNGVMQSLAPTFGQLYGAGKFSEMGKEARQGVWLAIFLSLAGSGLLCFPQPLLAIADASPEVTEKATYYLLILAFSLPASLNFLVYNTLNNAMARPKMVMAIQVTGLLLKIPLNTLFIFGGMGIPEFGGPGCALATFVIVWLELTIGWLILRFNPFYKILHLFGNGITGPHWKSLKALLALGIPIGLNYFIEVTSFTFMALFIARLGVNAVAGHQIVANFSGVLYMLPLSLASATGTLVAQSIGARQPDRARDISSSGIRLSAILAIIVAVTVWLAKDRIIRLYTASAIVAANASPLFLFLCSLLFFDAIQVTSSYVLRAYKVVLAPTLLYVLTLWCIGLGCGYTFAFGLVPSLIPSRITGSSGFWFSNCISLVILSVGMSILLRRTEKQAWKHIEQTPDKTP